MLRDPFFRFSGELKDVPLLHSAVGVPSCVSDTEAVMEITVDDGTSTTVPVERRCGNWFRVIGSAPLFESSEDGASPAQHYAVPGFGNTSGYLIAREADLSFDWGELWDAVLGLDSRVINQTVPEYNGTAFSSLASRRGSATKELLSLCLALAVFVAL